MKDKTSIPQLMHSIPKTWINLHFKEIQQKRNELKKWMKKNDDPLLYVFEHKDNIDMVQAKLYELYPDLERVDKIISSK